MSNGCSLSMAGVIQQVKYYNYRYLNELILLNCGPELLTLRVFPNSKEVTESFAAFRALRQHLRVDFPVGDKSIVAAVVGDGATPRTGATLAFRTAWQVQSIDPSIRIKPCFESIQRLKLVKEYVQNVPVQTFENLVIVHVHSHATLLQSLSAFRAVSRLAVVSIPCCVQQVLPSKPFCQYRDWGIWSPKNDVLVYKFIGSNQIRQLYDSLKF